MAQVRTTRARGPEERHGSGSRAEGLTVPDCVILANQSLPCAIVSNANDNDKGNLYHLPSLPPPLSTLPIFGRRKMAVKVINAWMATWSAVVIRIPDTDTANTGQLTSKPPSGCFCHFAILFMADKRKSLCEPLLNEAAGKSQKGISCNQ
ncbi:hypothetical protein ACLKA7_016078 [Drosophila subpalustris]